MVILGEVLVVGGSALVVTSAVFWVWFLMKQRLLRGPMKVRSNRRKPRDDEKSGNGSDRRGSYRIPSATLACKPSGRCKSANPTN